MTTGSGSASSPAPRGEARIDETRRRVGASIGVLALSGCATPPPAAGPAGNIEPSASGSFTASRNGDLVSGCRLSDGRMAVARVGVDGALRWIRPLPMRVHEILPDDRRGCLHVFARRPGRGRWMLALEDGAPIVTGDAGAGHVFCGHGALTPQGHLLSTEARTTDGGGCVAVRDAADGRLLARIECGGYDPHMVALMPGGRSLVVAIGGPRDDERFAGEAGRGARGARLSPRSSLAYFDLHEGRCLDRFHADDPNLSIRHLAVSPAGRVVLGMQWQGAADAAAPPAPLVASHGGESRLRPVSAPAGQWRRLRGYVGSVALSDDGVRACATSPRGGVAVTWTIVDERLDESMTHHVDVCGVTMTSNGTQPLLSGGDGSILAPGRPAGARPAYSPPIAAWDNHLARVVRAG